MAACNRAVAPSAVPSSPRRSSLEQPPRISGANTARQASRSRASGAVQTESRLCTSTAIDPTHQDDRRHVAAVTNGYAPQDELPCACFDDRMVQRKDRIGVSTNRKHQKSRRNAFETRILSTSSSSPRLHHDTISTQNGSSKSTLKKNTAVQVFSVTADRWVKAHVVNSFEGLEGDMVRVAYEAMGNRCEKTLSLRSESIALADEFMSASDVSSSSEDDDGDGEKSHTDESLSEEGDPQALEAKNKSPLKPDDKHVERPVESRPHLQDESVPEVRNDRAWKVIKRPQRQSVDRLVDRPVDRRPPPQDPLARAVRASVEAERRRLREM